jgi:hypothetical protein
MKTTLWIFLIVLLFGLTFSTYKVFTSKPAPPVKPDVVATNTDSTITAQMRKKIAKKDSLINAIELKLSATSEKVTDLKAINRKLKAGNDTLSEFYRTHHTLETCDSLVIAKQEYIDSLEQENDSLDSEAEQYSALLIEERGKYVDLGIVVRSHEKLISAYQQQFSRINCMDDWTSKHKFWSWLLGIKCK